MEAKKINKFKMSVIILFIALFVGIIAMTVSISNTDDRWLQIYSKATGFDKKQSIASSEDKREMYEVDEDGNEVKLLESSLMYTEWDLGSSDKYIFIRIIPDTMLEKDDPEYSYTEENWKNGTLVTTEYEGGNKTEGTPEQISLEEYFYNSGMFDYFNKIDFTVKDNFSKLKITGYPRHLNATIKNEKLDETIGGVYETIGGASTMMKNVSVDIQLDSNYNIKFQKVEFNDPDDKTLKTVLTTNIDQSSTKYSESLSTASIV